MGNFTEKEIEKLRRKRDLTLAETQLLAIITKDPKMMCVAKYMEFNIELEDMFLNEEKLTNKEAVDLINLMSQFQQILKDYKKKGAKESDNS